MIEIFYCYKRKHKPFIRPIKTELDNTINSSNDTEQQPSVDIEVKKENEKDIGEATKVVEESSKVTVAIKKTLDDETVVTIEEKEFLLGNYLGQYVIYTSASQAWILL